MPKPADALSQVGYNAMGRRLEIDYARMIGASNGMMKTLAPSEFHLIRR
jgi:hypothetical protein